MIKIHDQIVDPESGEVVAEPGQVDDYEHIERIWSVVMLSPDSFAVTFDGGVPHISAKKGDTT